MANEHSQHDNQTGNARAGQSRDCTALESLLTAFFDGECSVSESAYVRAHLDGCAHCSRAFEQWQSTRALFQIQPVPVPPTSLLARVRLAYQRAPEISETQIEAEIRDQLLLEETLLEAARGLEPEPFTPALRAYFAEAEPPATLKADILKNTVGAPVIVHEPVVAKTAFGSSLISERASIIESLQRLLNPASLRWAGALAVPTMAAWLILASSSTQIPTQMAVESLPAQMPAPASSPRTSKAPKLSTMLPTRNLKDLLRAPMTAISKPAAPNITMPSVASKPDRNDVRVAQSVETREPEASDTDRVATQSTPRVTDTDNSSAPRGQFTRVNTGSETKSAAWNLVTPPKQVVPKPVKIRLRPRFDARIREVSFTERAYSQATSVNSIRMASLRPVSLTMPPQPQSTARVASTPGRVAAINFQKAVEDFRNLRNPPEEDLRSVVNDYRASLASDGAEEATDDDFNDML
jgi:anti-sigma factor RsiW